MCKHAESLHPDPHRQALEALGSIVLCVHSSVAAEGGPQAPPAGAPAGAAAPPLAAPAAVALGQALPLLFAAISSEYDRSIVGSALAAFGTLCEGLPPGSLAHAAPALVDAIDGAPAASTPSQTCMLIMPSPQSIYPTHIFAAVSTARLFIPDRSDLLITSKWLQAR